MSRKITIALILLAGASAPAAGDSMKISLEGDLTVGSTDNLFRLSEEQTRTFDAEQAPGERLFDLDDPEDVVTRVRVGADLRWRLEKKRHLKLDLRGSRFVHSKNDGSDYSRFGARVRWDVSTRGEVFGAVAFTTDRFWKNYRIPSTSVFAPAIYDQTDTSVGYVRTVSKHLRVGGSLRQRDRSFEVPLESRDREGRFLKAFASYRVARRVDGRTSVELGEMEFDPVDDGGTLVDRSYDQQRVDQEFVVDLKKRMAVELLVQYRIREATTANAADLARFDRADTRWRYRLVWSKRLSKKVEIEASFRDTDNDSDRLDPAVEADEVGYDETAFGFSVRYEFL